MNLAEKVQAIDPTGEALSPSHARLKIAVNLPSDDIARVQPKARVLVRV